MLELIKKLQNLATSELPKQYEAQWGRLLESLERESWGDRISELLPQGLAIALAHWFVGQSLGPKAGGAPTLKSKSKSSEFEFAIEVDPVRIDYSAVLNKKFLTEDHSNRASSYVDPIRAAFLEKHGLPIPSVVVASTTGLEDDAYSISFDGVEVFRGRLKPDHMLLLAPYPVLERLNLHHQLVPEVGEPACWVPFHFQEEFQATGLASSPGLALLAEGPPLRGAAGGVTEAQPASPKLRFLTPRQVITQVLSVECSRQARLLCSRSTILERLQLLRGPKQQLVEELRRVRGIPILHRVAQRLLEERVSIRPLGTIVGSLLDHLPTTSEVEQLSGLIRRDLGRHLTRPFESPVGKLSCYVLASEVTREIRQRMPAGGNRREILPRAWAEALWAQLQRVTEQCWRLGKPAVLVVESDLRRLVFELALQRLPDPCVLSFDEIDPQVELVELESLSWDAPPADLPGPPESAEPLGTRGVSEKRLPEPEA